MKKRKENTIGVLLRMLLAALSGAMMVLAFPGFNMGFMAFIAMVPLFFALEGRKAHEAFLLSYLAGLVFFFGTVWWLMHVTLPGMIVLAFYLAIYFGIFGVIASIGLCPSENLSSRVLSYMALFYIPAAWVTCEWLRSHIFTGFGWVALGYSQSASLPIIQIADITGVYGVSFIIVMMNIAIFLTLKGQQEKGSIIELSTVIAVVIVFLCLTYGFIRLNNIFTGDKISVGVVQGIFPRMKNGTRLSGTG
ncbi:MAG: hypothetical protein E4G89_07560 [Methanothrix sp.]|nr:MAG: hypothetical protein E4G89_07560 [Methanothrix sp.]